MNANADRDQIRSVYKAASDVIDAEIKVLEDQLIDLERDIFAKKNRIHELKESQRAFVKLRAKYVVLAGGRE